MYWLTSRNSKLPIYKIIIKPIWTYGLQIWGMVKSNIKKIENLQSIILRAILDAQWYIRNDDTRKTLEIPTVKEEIVKRARDTMQNQKSQEPPGKRLLLPTTQKTEKETPARPN